jgi:predicted ArsR family transcriptional regulator
MGAERSVDERRAAVIIEQLKDGPMTAREAATLLGEDGSTVRRDLDSLAREGRVQKAPYAGLDGSHVYSL